MANSRRRQQWNLLKPAGTVSDIFSQIVTKFCFSRQILIKAPNIRF